ncbi:hypothetical protein [Methylocapsa acidiphila]|uniref:hypothetical protein n=1 Tax=Methylocapsa acidiphila TaxID=133552 RepID=UPI001AEBDA69|nr:hypothetical protein [Methylocapsa acidiphila]
MSVLEALASGNDARSRLASSAAKSQRTAAMANDGLIAKSERRIADRARSLLGSDDG